MVQAKILRLWLPQKLGRIFRNHLVPAQFPGFSSHELQMSPLQIAKGFCFAKFLGIAMSGFKHPATLRSVRAENSAEAHLARLMSKESGLGLGVSPIKEPRHGKRR